MSVDEAIEELKVIPNERLSIMACEARDMAITALEAQKKLSEYICTDVCEWVEDYDYDENNVSHYEYVCSVDDFLIPEAKEASE